MRITMRVAYATANPVTIMQKNKTITQRFPFGAVTDLGDVLSRSCGPAAGACVDAFTPYRRREVMLGHPAGGVLGADLAGRAPR